MVASAGHSGDCKAALSQSSKVWVLVEKFMWAKAVERRNVSNEHSSHFKAVYIPVDEYCLHKTSLRTRKGSLAICVIDYLLVYLGCHQSIHTACHLSCDWHLAQWLWQHGVSWKRSAAIQASIWHGHHPFF